MQQISLSTENKKKLYKNRQQIIINRQIVQKTRNKKQKNKMIDNQRINTIGSNESQEGLESNSSRNFSNHDGTHKSLSLWMLQKFSFHVSTIIRYVVCIFIGLILANRVSSQNYSQLSNGIVASNDILLDKGLRGIFPPLSGNRDSLYGKWVQAITTSVQNSTDEFNNYILNIKQNGDIEVTHKQCKGDIKMQWNIFYYNIGIKDKEKSQQQKEQEMEIPNQQQDIKCLMEDGKFMEILKNSSIWSIHSNNLYIISEGEASRDTKIDTRMLIFQKSA